MRQQTAKRWLAKLLVFIMLISVCGTISPVRAKAADTLDIKVTGTYGQTEARTMLSMMNAFRTGSDAWQWNESDTEKVAITGLSALAYDYNLEEIAMQRAMEIAVSFSHTRPNGERCFTAYTGGYRATGENIAVGQRSAAEVFAAWQETNEKYAGQGHRRNMLSDKFGSVGIGHVYLNGYDYWVQEFGDRVVTAESKPANDAKTTVTIPISESRVAASKYTPSVDGYQLGEKEYAALPKVSLDMSVMDVWPAG